MQAGERRDLRRRVIRIGIDAEKLHAPIGKLARQVGEPRRIDFGQWTLRAKKRNDNDPLFSAYWCLLPCSLP